MKKMIWVLAIATLLLVSAGFVITNPVWKKEQKPQANIPVDTARLRADVVRLTSTSQPRSYDHPEALREAAAYIAREWTAAGLTPEIQPFKAAGQTYTNVIARYGPNGAPRLVVGAHYDVCEHLPGADDNASGVAGILELARLLQQLKPTLDYQVELVAYCLEEPPFFRTDAMGSAVHAKSLKADSVEVLGMVVLEMIGYFTDAPKSQEYPVKALKVAYPSRGNFIAVVGKLGQGNWVRHVKKHMKAASDLPVHSINAPASIPGIDFSDHLNYWNEGYRALMITNTSFYRNKNYHQASDTPETLDYGRMGEVVKGVYWAMANVKT